MSYSVPTDSVIRRSSCGVTGLVQFPLTGILPNGNSLGIAGFGIPYFFFLDVLFTALAHEDFGYAKNSGDGEDESWISWEDQQTLALGWLERKVESYGLSGRTCIMRFVCEMQHHPIHQFSVIGETLSVLFSLNNHNSSSEVLQQYVAAQDLGRELPNGEPCGDIFPCPVSVFKLFGGSLNRTVYL
ncbi:uncharacterized protein [Palaemon carinicauda]|uniref:uncharacterized protein n=1 Tax=Palaemon carinicauda TaxID=392227 RepID=UPI0035B5FDF6